MSDEKFLKKQFKNVFGYELDLENPITYSEKLQWLKLFDRNPKYTKLVDKYEVKKIIAEMIGDEYIIPTIGVWDKFDEIDFTKLPQQFVLKCTHDSGGLVICKDKNEFNIKKAKKKIEKCLKNDYYMQNREWPYKNVKPRIIAEEYMVDESGYELKDYKIFCFNGEAKAMFIASDRSNPKEETKFDFYDMNFNHLPFENGHPNSKKEIKKPESLELMTKLAETLSVELPQARIDFYDINGKVYFGEITFFHWSGFKKFEPKEWDEIFGGWIKLPLS
nr:ATP-grasp fold amidoligase family protein [uncultured Clostridium sp.]